MAILIQESIQANGRKQLNAPILDFRNRIGDLARPNLFQVEIGFPGIVDSGTQLGCYP